MNAYPGMKRRLTIGQSVLILAHLCLAALFVLPIILTLSISLSSPKELMYHNAGLLPSGFSLEAYVTLLGDSNLPRYYLNTIFYAAFGTLIMLFCTMLLAFTLTKKSFSGRKTINVLLLITMFFNGGLVPTYLLINNLGMYDTIWAIMLPGAVSAYNVFVVKTFIKELPDALIDAAAIDGASHFRTLFQIVIPLSKPVIATLALFSIVGYWNEYFSAVMYLRREELHPIVSRSLRNPRRCSACVFRTAQGEVPEPVRRARYDCCGD